MTLKNKTTFITGCNRGIGRAIMTLFAKEGSNIIACVRKNDAEFFRYLEDISHIYHIQFEIIYFDMLDEESVKSSIRPLMNRKVKIDILVNNAGIAAGALLHMTPMKMLKEMFQINFFSQVLITQLVSKSMMRERRGSIINMGSIGGLDNVSGNTAYGSSKAAIMYFTKTIANELSKYNIRVNAIAPGLTNTDMGSKQIEQGALAQMKDRVNLNRLASPQEIAELALFLASDKSSFITGQIIRIDGGI
jgi:3-oxoacyl-[acyl-carrier protein] reductase